MFSTVIRTSLRHSLLLLVLTTGLVIAGVRAWINLPIDAFPDISPTQVKIILKVPGMTPEEVEQRVVRPVEIEMLALPKKVVMRSLSKYGIADITIDFREGVDVYWARQQVSEHLASVMPVLPSGVSGGMAPIATPLSEMYMFTLEGKDYDLKQKRQVLDWTIRPALRTISGVADVNVLGGEILSFEVIPDVARLVAMGVSMSSLRQALLLNNSNDGAGRIDVGEGAWVVRVEGALRSLDDLKQIRVMREPQGTTVALQEIATVRMGSVTRYGAVTKDGQGEAVEGLVVGLRGANARDLVREVQKKLHELESKLPVGMSINTFYNRGDLVSQAANTVVKALLEATVLVCVALYLFLGGLRAAFVVALTLPLSILATFIVMGYLGITANLMSLGGLAIAVGILVDAAVVVVENIEASHVQQHQHGSLSSDQVAIAVEQVVKPVTAGIFIIAVVFLPLLGLEGLEGKLFAPVALTIVIALVSSWGIAFSIVPVLAFWLLSPAHSGTSHMMQKLEAVYVRVRDFAWQHTLWLDGVIVVGILVGVVLYFGAGKTFMPTLDEGSVLVQLQTEPAVSLDTTLAINTRVQQEILSQVPEVQSVIARTGSDDLGLDPMGLHETDTFLVLKPKWEWSSDKADIVNRLRRVLEKFPGLDYSFTQPIEMRVAEMLSGSRGDVVIKVFGHDTGQLVRATEAISTAIRAVRGAGEVIVPRSEGLQYLTVTVNRMVAGQAGFSVDELQQHLRSQLEGQALGIVLQGKIRTPLVLRGGDRTRSGLARIFHHPLPQPKSTCIDVPARPAGCVPA